MRARFHNADVQGEGEGDTTLRASKLGVVELREKKQRIGLDEYSQMVVWFLILGQYFTQLREDKGQIFAKSTIFTFTLADLKQYKL